MYNAEDIFESLNVHHQDLKLDDLAEIQKPNALEEADEPEPKERTMTDVKLTKGLGLTEVIFDFMFQLNAPFPLLHLLYSSTCFEQHYAHHQENLLYTYSIWFFVCHSS